MRFGFLRLVKVNVAFWVRYRAPWWLGNQTFVGNIRPPPIILH